MSGMVVLWDRAQPPVTGQIHYQLAWETGDALRLADAWQITTALGYTVQLRRGYVLSYSAQALPCEHDHPFWQDLFGGMTVYADHAVDPDEAQTSYSLVESLLTPALIEWDTRVVHQSAYCQTHYVMARKASDQTTRFMPTEVDLSRVTVYLEGVYQLGDAEAREFLLTIPFADGGIADLMQNGATIHAQIGADPIVIRIIRRLDRAFDRVDFETMSVREQAIAWMRQVVSDLRVEVISGRVHP
jgi:hypothetical protein